MSITNQAYVTLVTQERYVLGAVVLAHSLRDTNTSRQLAVMISKDLPEGARQQLSTVYDKLHEVSIYDSKDTERLQLLQRPELGVTFTKLGLWTLSDYEKVVFLDADTLVLKNVDDLFERPEFSAAPDIGWPDCFNSGVFVAVPNPDTFQRLLQAAESTGSFDGGDQGLLNSFFSGWSTDQRCRLPFLYNVIPGTYYSYSPAYRHFHNDIKIVHFTGPNKPWLVSRPEPTEANELILFWWAVHDMHNLQSLTPAPPVSTQSVSALTSHPSQPSEWQKVVHKLDQSSNSAQTNWRHKLQFADVDAEELYTKTETLQTDQRTKLLQGILHEVRVLNQQLGEQRRARTSDDKAIEKLEERIGDLTQILTKWHVY